MEEILSAIKASLIEVADEKTRLAGQRFFKEKIVSYGVKSALVGKISNDYFKQVKHLSKNEIFNLCECLWQSEFIEETFIACSWSYKVHKDYLPQDFVIFEKWIKLYVNNWASCDTFCNHTMGEFITMYPEFLKNLKEFAKSESRWVRRAAAVSLIIPARNGKFLSDIFEIANILLTDKDDLVQKGYGWMLKAAGDAHRNEVFEFVMQNRAVMPRTALRYAIEKMPVEMKKRAMEK